MIIYDKECNTIYIMERDNDGHLSLVFINKKEAIEFIEDITGCKKKGNMRSLINL